MACGRTPAGVTLHLAMNVPTPMPALVHAKPVVVRHGRFGDWRLALRTVAGFWFVYLLTVVARAWLGSDPVTVLQNKVFMVVAGVVLTAGIYLVIRLVAPDGPVRRQAVVAGLASTAAAALMTAILVGAQDHLRDTKEEFRFEASEGFVVTAKGQQLRIERKSTEPVVLTMPKLGQLPREERLRIAADTAVVWLFFFAAWSAFYLAAVSQARELDLQRRAATAEAAAQNAHVRALRYQVNPHFLFNTLNSLSSLVMTGRPQEAETMILRLSNFFRTSLSLDPQADVTLAEEIDLQQVYLEIEKVRFPRRLKVVIDIPPELLGVRLPALILQPIVENAIKYGVSASRERVLLTITARSLPGDRIEIAVVNSCGAPPRKARDRAAPGGTGLGLANVRDRLQARFGGAADCHFGALDDGGFQVVMRLPVTADD
jgi:two-component system, LytTR family, sensor kinase